MLDRRTGALKLPTAPSRRLSPSEVARRLESAVAILGTFYECDKCTRVHVATASGFFLNAGGALATCRHVLANYQKNGRGVVVLTRHGQVCPVTGVLAADPLQDLLVLQVEGDKFHPLPLEREVRPGSPVTVMSHPENHYFVITTGVVAREGVERRSRGLFRFLTITADFAKGSSGAPVCNEAGAVIGLVNNTESIYYTTEGEEQKNLQMVLKNCAPAGALLDLVPRPTPTPAKVGGSR